MKCKRCGVDSEWFTFDRTYYENTGKSRIWDRQREMPHQCKIPEPEKPFRKVCPKCAIAGKTVIFKTKKSFVKHYKMGHFH